MSVVRLPADDLVWGNSSSSGSQAANVSADADLLVVSASWYYSPASTPVVSWQGQPLATASFRQSGGQPTWVGYLWVKGLYTGAGTLLYDVGDRNEGVVWSFHTYKNVDQALPIIGADDAGDGNANNLVVTFSGGLDGDMMYAAAQWSGATANMDVLGQTQITQGNQSSVDGVTGEKLYGVGSTSLRAEGSGSAWCGMAGILIGQGEVTLKTGTGDLVADDGAVGGAGVSFSVSTGTGDLVADDGAVGGAGNVISVFEGTGVLVSDDAVIGGIGTIPAKVREGTGTLQASDGAVDGVGGGVVPGSGSLISDDSVISGIGSAFLLVTGTGDLQAEGDGVTGVGVVGEDILGGGALVSGDAVVNGAGITILVGDGALVSEDAFISGTGDVIGTASGTGSLTSGSAFVNGLGGLLRQGDGSLIADDASVSGVGFNIKPSDTTLTTQDLVNIQEAVWAKLVNEGLVAKVEELWQRRGLDPANPHRQNKSDGIIEVGNITIDVVGDANEVTQTRRP